MPTSLAPISPSPFVKWRFKANTATEKKEKITRARTILTAFLKGYQEALALVPGLKKRNYRIVNKVIPNRNGWFTYSPTVKRKPVTAGQPEAGKDPQRPTPPPSL